MGQTIYISIINVKTSKVTDLKNLRIGLYGIAQEAVSDIEMNFGLYLFIAISFFISFLIIVYFISKLCCRDEEELIRNIEKKDY